jgi:2-(1,2-epoxy-1,2-dihydrophenyl)acetyl-CoA isomerase
MSDDVLLLDVTAGVATVTLNRPKAANGIDLPLGKALMLAAIECDENPDVRAVVLTGAGKMFCAGGDLKSFAGFGDALPSKLKELTTYLHAATSRFARMDAPLICAINGVAAGAGMSLAVSGEFALAAESAKLTMAYTGAGLSPDGSSTFFLPRLIGLRRTQELMITNRRLSAAEALEWGLLTKVVADDGLLEEAQALASQLAQGPTRAYGQVKQLLATSSSETLETQLELESRGIAAMAGSPDGREGIQAFVEKRAPKFSGR